MYCSGGVVKDAASGLVKTSSATLGEDDGKHQKSQTFDVPGLPSVNSSIRLSAPASHHQEKWPTRFSLGLGIKCTSLDQLCRALLLSHFNISMPRIFISFTLMEHFPNPALHL